MTAGGPGTTFARAATAAPGGQVWTVQESPGANPGWTLDSLTCTSPGASSYAYSASSGGVDTKASITLSPGDSVTCTATNSPLSSLTVEKLDSSTQQPVAGAGFTLYRESNGSAGLQLAGDTLVGSCTTAAPGTCAVAGLAPGRYYWVETSAPTGYTLDPAPVAVTITPATAGTTVITPITDDEKPTVLTVHKSDAAHDTPLAGAVFALHAASATGPTVGTCTTAATGDCAVTVATFGTYYWLEVTAPANYLLNTDPVAVTVTAATAGSTDAAFTSKIQDIHQIITGPAGGGSSPATPTAPVNPPVVNPPVVTAPVASLASTGPGLSVRTGSLIGIGLLSLGLLLVLASRRRS